MIVGHWLARLPVALLAFLCVLPATAAAAAEEVAVDIASVDAREPGDVVAVVSVLHDSGRPVLGLTDENFAARIDGSPASIADVTSAVNSGIGIAVVLAVDVSGSMGGDPLVQAREAARAFVDGLAPIDSVALVTFGDDAALVLNFTADQEAVFAALDTLLAVGDTALYQATSASAYVATAAQTQRKAVILLSDGVDFGNRSAVSREESLAQAAAVGVPFFAVGLGQDIDGAYLEALAQATGGQFLETPSAEGLSELYGAIGDFLRSQYVVTLSPGSLGGEQRLMLEIEVTVGEASGVASEALPALEAPPATGEGPAVTISGLASGAEIDTTVSLSVQVTGELPLKTVRMTVDGTLLTELTAPPYDARLDPTAYAVGSHVLRVEAIDTAGGLGVSELSFVAATPAGGGPPSGLLIAGAVLLLLVAVPTVGLLAVRRRRPETGAGALMTTRVRPWSPRRDQEPESWQPSPGEAPTLRDEPRGRLTVAAGTGQGESLEIGLHPRRIGSAPHCDLVLVDEEGSIAPEEARVWVSEDRLMYHKLTRLTAFASDTDGPTSGWFVLQDGDDIRVGPHRLVFELLAQEDDVAEALAQLKAGEVGQPGGESEEEAASEATPRIWRDDMQFRRPARAEESDGDGKAD